ncbi:divalent cation tolerance protein CutA [Flavobacteriaceae bacterium R38]|nr:divalent cation tolerance protein CutA [Flavobacteriaceae bacterium R38]
MVLVHIIVEKQDEVTAITNLLVNEKLIVESYSIEKVSYKKRAADAKQLSESKQVLIIARTKALLFAEINKKIKEMYRDKMPVIYALPIVYMDADQTEFLLQNTKTV